MIDYEGIRAYLIRLGFAETGINTYITSYLHEKKIDILNNFDTYKNLTDEEKLLKFSEDNNISKIEFDKYHEYAKEHTFRDMRSGARRYKLYKQYQGVMNTIKRYDEDSSKFETHGAVWYFRILDIDNNYPVKAICRENIELLELKENFTTDQAKEKLKKIFNVKGHESNIKFINEEGDKDNSINDRFTDEQIEIFIQIAKEKHLRYHCSSGKKYFQIYPKSADISEGVSGLHYEFWKDNTDKYSLMIHTEKKTKFREQLCRDIFNQKVRQTVVSVDIYDDNDVILEFNKLYSQYEDAINTFYLNQSIKEKGNQDMKQPLNKILYGPPGTGKTYNTINKALEIIDGTVPDNREEAKDRFKVLKEAGQIEFVTFHQSYGYEEFVEGIKAKTTDGKIEYSIEPGIFKSICKESSLKKIFKIGTQIGKYRIIGISDEILKLERESKAIIPIPMYLLKEVLELIDKKIITTDDLNNKTAVDKMSATTEKYIINGYPNIFKYLSEHYLENKNHFSDQKYILIIDEINRGNISKIFGELITLIEESKRLGNIEAMEVTLPYSREKFGVPNNLYIIGTMNTADRSIALMDTALRRRFEFEEMMPKPELLEMVDSIDLNRLLSKINQRIEYLYDRDHTIGHAYFIEVKSKNELDSVLQNKVIPLLQEYFYDDWEKIRLVLNDGFISKIEQKPNEIFDVINDEFVDEEKYTYDIVDYFSEESYRKIYE